jgi:hypothetical protein
MNKKDWSEEDVIEHLKNMPQINDTRSKEEIYRNIEHRLPSKKPNNMKKWFVTLATSAAAVAFLLLLPSFEKNDITSPLEPTQDTGNFLSDNNEPSISENNNLSSTSLVEETDNSVKLSSTLGDNYQGSLINYGHSLDVVTIAVPDPQAEIMIPLTFLTKREGLMNDADLYNSLNSKGIHVPNGLSNFIFANAQFSRGDDGKTLHIDVYENHQFASGSASVMIFYATVEALLNYSEFDSATFSTEGKSGMELDNVGMVYEVKQSKKNKGYYLYEVAETMQQYLVPIPFEGLSFEQMLNQMSIQDVGKNYTAIIPPGLIQKVEGNGKVAVITLGEGYNLIEIENNIAVIDSILLTAKDYGYDYVKFNSDIEMGIIGQYTLSDKIEVPLRPNAIILY